ncbi:MAG: NAD-dependent epimerase/dehydratase family protein [Candidatus Heimdallarchaeota archaeon]
MKILVTGIAGFIGSHLAERLGDLGYEVVGIDCFTDYYSRELKQLNMEKIKSYDIPVYNFDLAKDGLKSALQGVDVIYHLAAQPGISISTPFEEYVKNNIIATKNLVDSCRNLSSLNCFVNISTSSVYGAHATDPEDAAPKPTSFYGVTKLCAEQLVLAYHREYGFPACSLRIFSVYGPRERPEKLFPKIILSILNNTSFPLYEGSETHSRSYTYVEDIIHGLISVLNHKDKAIGEIFNLGSPVEVTTGETIKIVEQIMGKEAQKDVLPKRPGDQIRTWANINKARSILGFEPQTRIEDGLKLEIDWFREIYEKNILYE